MSNGKDVYYFGRVRDQIETSSRPVRGQFECSSRACPVQLGFGEVSTEPGSAEPARPSQNKSCEKIIAAQNFSFEFEFEIEFEF